MWAIFTIFKCKMAKKWTLKKLFPRFGILVLKQTSLFTDSLFTVFCFPQNPRRVRTSCNFKGTLICKQGRPTYSRLEKVAKSTENQQVSCTQHNQAEDTRVVHAAQTYILSQRTIGLKLFLIQHSFSNVYAFS